MKWRPISEAPRNGSSILIHVDGFNVPAVAHWIWSGDKDLMQGYWDADTTFYFAPRCDIQDIIDTSKVTHWMPLPEPPEVG